MAQVYGQVNLVWLRYFKSVTLVLHVYSDKLVTDLWSVFSVIHEAELLGLYLLLQSRVILKLDILTFNFLLPSDFVQTLSEKNSVHENGFVKSFVHFLGKSEKIKSEYFINEHVLSIIFSEIVVISLPLFAALRLILRVLLGLFSVATCSSFWLRASRLSLRFAGKLHQVFVNWIISERFVLFVSFEKLVVDLFKVS